MTTVDALTGFPSRPDFETTLATAIDSESTVSLAVLDVNMFKDINDTFGHEVGDRILSVLAIIMRDFGGGRYFRIAGDEFAVLMPDTSLELAFLSMEGLRRAIVDAADRFAVPDGRAVAVGIGVAHYPRDAKDAEGLHRAAAAALAYSKETGSSHVVLPLNEEMVMKSCYYTASSVRRLKTLAERSGKKESILLREALIDLLRKYDTRD